MTAVFIHDHYFVYNSKDQLYYDGSGGVFDKYLWNRYLSIFDSLIVVGREIHSLPNKLVISSCQNVSFELIDDLRSGKDRVLKANRVKKKLEVTLSKVDFAIIRVPSSLGYFAQAICDRKNKPYLLEIVACPWDAYWNYGKVLAKLVAPIEYLKLRMATQKASACIYVTKTFLQKRYPTKAFKAAISNVRIEEAIDPCIVEGFYCKNEISEFKIALIGSFHVKYKGHIEALKALKFIISKRHHKNIKLYFVGTGDPHWIRKLAQKLGVYEYVVIIGTLKAGNEGIIPFLDGIHLYIHPSRQEGLPRVVIEAMSRGRLVLGSSAAGIPELLKMEYLHSPGDWRKLANDIVMLYNNRENWIDISRENIRNAKRYLEVTLQSERTAFFQYVISKLNK